MRTGAESRMNFMVDSLSRRGLEVHVFSRKREAELAICKSAFFHKSPWLDKAILRPESIRSFAKVSAVCLKNLTELLGGYRFDIVQSEEVRLAMPGSVLSKLTRVPLILDEPDVQFDKAKQWRSLGNWRTVFLVERLFCRNAQQVLTSSSREKKIMKHSFGLSDSRISVIPNGVDTTWFSPGGGKDLRSKLGLSERPVVLFMGNFGYFPNVDAFNLIVSELLSRVREAIRDVVFLVIGKGLCLTAASPTYNLRPVGFVSDPRPYMDIADVCISPLRYGGGTRIKILEYMSMGKAVVSTSKGCEGLAVTRESDILVEDTADGFARAIVSLLRNDNLTRKIGGKARETAVRSYDWSDIAGGLVSVYVQVLNGSSMNRTQFDDEESA